MCFRCNKSFLLSHHLSRHVRAHQAEQTIYKCPECSKEYDSADAFIQCAASHAVETSDCPICKEPFNEQSQVEAHLKLHITKKRFNCDYCDMSFIREEQLDRHCLQNHANEMCTIIPAEDNLPGDEDIVEEYFVQELELSESASPSPINSKRPLKVKTDLDSNSADGDQFFVIVEESDGDVQPLPAKLSKTSQRTSVSVQDVLTKLPKGVTVKRDGKNYS